MSLRDIVLYPADVLAKRAVEVGSFDAALDQLVEDMIQTMYEAPGIGLAAPQVGVLQRVTVIDVSPREAAEDEPAPEPELHVLINPQIVHRQGKIVWEEGCLSIPGVYEKVDRAERVVVQALDRRGQPLELEATGLLAVCIQHELDHLDGVVFLDRLSPLKRRMALKKYRKRLERRAQQDQDEAEA